jgi:hypothetical protein
MSVCPVCLGADTTTTICANCAFVLQRLGVALPDPDPSKPVERKLNDETKEQIRKNIDSYMCMHESASAAMVKHYIISLLENQWPSFWEK